MTFEELGIRDDLLRGISELGFENPMPVQEKVIPRLLDGNHDLVGLAQTGTGKTAAYLLPVIDRIADDPDRGDKVQCTGNVAHSRTDPANRPSDGGLRLFPARKRHGHLRGVPTAPASHASNAV